MVRHKWRFVEERYLVEIWNEPEIKERLEDKLFRGKANLHELIAKRLNNNLISICEFRYERFSQDHDDEHRVRGLRWTS